MYIHSVGRLTNNRNDVICHSVSAAQHCHSNPVYYWARAAAILYYNQYKPCVKGHSGCCYAWIVLVVLLQAGMLQIY